MAVGTKISAMPAVTSITGDEIIPVVTNGQNKTVTASQLRDGLASQTKVDEIDEKLKYLDWLNTAAYGVEWDDAIASPDCTRVGNMAFHATLPIQSKFKGCVVQDRTVNYYLHPDNWAYKEDGVTPSVLDGTDGTVEVDTGGKFYGRSFDNGTKHSVYISEIKPDDSWIEIPRLFVGAYRCCFDRTDANNIKAVSVVNITTSFRGGNNNSTYDQYLETDPFRSNLGKPSTSVNTNTARQYANNAHRQLMTYEQYMWICLWLPVIEYATFNMQQAFNPELNSAGYKQGGLGAGVTNINNWQAYNNYNPLIPCGTANSLGNHTGVVTVTSQPILNEDDSVAVASNTWTIARYRGIENIFGDIWQRIEGTISVNDREGIEDGANSTHKLCYSLKNPHRLCDLSKAELDALKLNTLIVNSEINPAYKLIGKYTANDGYVKNIITKDMGYFLCSAVGGSSTTYYCDYQWQGNKTNTTIFSVWAGGGAANGAVCGLGCLYSGIAVGYSVSDFGFRCTANYNQFKLTL